MSHLFVFAAGAPGVLYALEKSTLVGKAVILVLFLISIVAWSIMITKFRQVGRAQRSSGRFLMLFRGEKDVRALRAQTIGMRDCPLHEIYAAGCGELEACGNPSSSLGAGGAVTTDEKLSALDIVHIEAALERAVSEQAMVLENQLTVLATAVSAAPFLGLLGTVWGVMDAFADIATTQSTSIGALAPGVSAALITTVAGLFVAIPSMVGYNILVRRIHSLTVMMDNFASEFMTAVRRETTKEEA